MKIKDAMTAEVVSVTPTTPLKEVAELLVERRISGVPVIDEYGTLVGIVSEADFVAKEAGSEARRSSWVHRMTGASHEERHEQAMVAARTAGEAMTSPVVTITMDRPLTEAARRMEENRINRLPVLDDGSMVGIVTRADIVRAYARTDEDLQRAASEALWAVDGLRVADVRNGVVVLNGTVASQALAEAVTVIVRQIDGVVAVDAHDLSWLPPVRATTIV